MSTEKKIVDARGLSCPQPVLETKRAVEKSTGGEIEVLVDTVTSRENVMRFARNAGWQANFEEAGGYFRIALKK
ncbi:sulfurtransferase TusA family protein [Synergistaceae bacterium OttesenSCG-928-I11]|nr:sulfurtransferase TusA family protein [Synergistaceae bacterium OttesenSCG-928-I11]